MNHLEIERLPAAEAFVRDVVEGVFGQRISPAEVGRVARRVVAATTLPERRPMRENDG